MFFRLPGISMVLLLASQFLSGQSEIRGFIFNKATGQPVMGVSVLALSSDKGTISAPDGNFELRISRSEDSILVSHLGFERQIMAVTAGTGWIEIGLMPANLDLDPVIITATRTKRQLSSLPVNIDVINREHLLSYPGLKLYEAMEQSGGLNMNRQGGIYTLNPVVSLRGMPGDDQVRTLVLIDGLPVNIADNGEVRWNMFNQRDAGQVEIQKGPGSALFGNNAMGGVINLVSRQPVQGVSGGADIIYGSYHTFISNVRINFRNKNGIYAGLSQHYLNSDGYNDVPAHLKGDPDYSIPRFLKEMSISGRIGYAGRKLLNVDISFDYYRDKRGEGEKIMVPEGGYRSFNNEHLRARVFGENKKWSYQAGLFYLHEAYSDLNEMMRGADYARFDVLSDRIDYGGIFQLSSSHINGQRITGGLEMRNGSVEGGDYYRTVPYDTMLNSGNINSIALFIQDEWNILPGSLSLVGGLRYDMAGFFNGYYYTSSPWNNIYPILNDQTWNALSPRLSCLYKPLNSFAMSLGFSRGFRTAVLDDLTRTGFVLQGPKYANPSLNPETLNNMEFGIKYSPDSSIIFKAAAFFSNGTGFHYYLNTGDTVFGRPVYRKENISEVRIGGFEISMDFRIGRVMAFQGNYTFNKSIINKSDSRPELDGKYLIYVPKHQVKAGLSVYSEIISGSVFARFKSQQFTLDDNAEFDRWGNPAVINEYITADVSLWKKWGIAVFKLTVTNIGNLQYLDNALYLAPGRMITGSVGVEF